MLSCFPGWRSAPTQFFSWPAGGDWLHSPGHGRWQRGRDAKEVRHGRANNGCAGHPPHCSGGGPHHRAGRTAAAPEAKELSLRWASQTHFVRFLSGYVKSDSLFIWQPPRPTRLMVVSSQFPVRALPCVTCQWLFYTCSHLHCLDVCLCFSNPVLPCVSIAQPQQRFGCIRQEPARRKVFFSLSLSPP